MNLLKMKLSQTKYWDKYDDIEEDEWEKFLIELCNKHGVLISKELTEIEEL